MKQFNIYITNNKDKIGAALNATKLGCDAYQNMYPYHLNFKNISTDVFFYKKSDIEINLSYLEELGYIFSNLCIEDEEYCFEIEPNKIKVTCLPQKFIINVHIF